MQSLDIQTVLGQLVLSAAHIEYNLRAAILVLTSNIGLLKLGSVDIEEDSSRLYNEKLKRNNALLAGVLLPSNLQMNRKIELLRRIVKITSTGQALKDWKDLTADVEELSKERNSYIHSMYGVDENNLIRLEIQKGAKGSCEYISEEKVDIDDIVKLVNRLNDRNRQLVDFIEDYPSNVSESKNTVPQSQSKHPRLKL